MATLTVDYGDPTYQLNLSKAEAQFLVDVLAHVDVGGGGRRVHSAAIYNELVGSGLDWTYENAKDISGGVDIAEGIA